MAKVYRRAGGQLGFRATADEETAAPIPADVADTFAFDEDTNAALVADIRQNLSALYTLTAGVLKKSGATVTPSADGDRAGLKNAASAAVSANQTYLAIGSPTTAQVTAQVRALTQQINQVIRRLLQLSQ